MKHSTGPRRPLSSESGFVGFRFAPEVIAVRWYLRFNLAYRDVEELLIERGIEVDHITVFRWVQRFTPLLADAARFCRHSPGNRRFGAGPPFGNTVTVPPPALYAVMFSATALASAGTPA